MVERKRLSSPPANTGGDYFPESRRDIPFISSGCSVLDCVLGGPMGGWAGGRVGNIVGDKSVGKTLLAIEATANFARTYPKGKIRYREAEGAFDIPHAQTVGLPLDRVDFGPEGIDTIWDTIEDIFDDLKDFIKELRDCGQPGLFVIDSLDALVSRAALKRDVGDGSYNLEKQKILGQLFQELVRDMKAVQMTLLIISQIRERIGFVVGEKHKRSGGKALDFYASQVIWASHVKTLVRTVGGVKRPTGVQIRIKCRKNKVALPFRECEFTVRFGFGIEDAEAGVAWLEEHKMLGHLGLKVKDVDDYLAECGELDGAEYQTRCAIVRQAVSAAWVEVEGRFKPTRSKYG